jgi:hypothetical protein
MLFFKTDGAPVLALLFLVCIHSGEKFPCFVIGENGGKESKMHRKCKCKSALESIFLSFPSFFPVFNGASLVQNGAPLFFFFGYDFLNMISW